MLFNNRSKKESTEATGNPGALSVQQNIGGSLFAPSLNPRPTRLNLRIESASEAPPLQVEEPSLTEEGFHTSPPESFDPTAFEPAWLNSNPAAMETENSAAPVRTADSEIPQFPAWTAPTEEIPTTTLADTAWDPSQEFSFNNEAPTVSPWESSSPAADVFAGNTTGDPANWHEPVTEFNEPSLEPLGLEVAMPWAVENETPAFSTPDTPATEPEYFQPSAPPFMTEGENFKFDAFQQTPEIFLTGTTSEPTENHFLDSVHEQLYPADTFPTEAFQYPEQPKAKILPPLPASSADPWTESANQFDEASQYLFPEDSQLTGRAQNWYEQGSEDSAKTPSAIYWPEEVLNSEMLELGTSVQENLNGLQELNNEPGYTLPSNTGTTLPEFDFPTQSQSELETLSFASGAGIEFNEPDDEQLPSDFSWGDTPSGWNNPSPEGNSGLENASWVFPSTPESEPSFTLNSDANNNLWETSLTDHSQNDFFAPPQTLDSPSSWEISAPAVNNFGSQSNDMWTSPLDRGEEEKPSYSIDTPSAEPNLFEFPSDENLWYGGSEATTHFQANDPFMASAPTMESSQLEPPTLKTDISHPQLEAVQTPSFLPEEMSYQAPPEASAKLGKLDILGVCPLPNNQRLLVVYNGDVYALMGQNNAQDETQIAVLHVFDRNPLAYQSTFTVIKDTRPDRVGHMIVQAGSVRGQISIEQGKIMWHGETS